MKDQAIATKVIECVAKSLALSPEVIHYDSKVMAELGADSLDFMDMIFALEQAFGIRLQKENFNMVSRLGMEQSEALTPDGSLAPAARRKLQYWFADIPMEGELKPSDLSRFFTIRTFTVIVRDLLEGKGLTSTETSGEAATAAPPA